MNLNQAINEYRQLSVSQAMAEAVGGVALCTVANQKENFFQRVNDSINNLMEQDADDFFSATLLFSEMSLRKIGQVPPYLAYYYGTLAQNSANVPVHSKIAALRLRLFALFHHLEAFDRFINLAHTAPMMEYAGNLSMEQFFDFLIMADAYRVWDSDDESSMLKSIKRLVNQHKINHPQFTREQIIKEGEIAHKALFTAIKYVLHKL